MRILLVSCVFPPELVVSARTSADLAEALSRRGHQVTVVAPFPSRPGGRIHPGFRRRLFQRSRNAAGYDVRRCFSFVSRRSSLLGRFFENASFGVTGAWAALTAARPDVIYGNTWPIVATGLLALAARCRGVPLVISVQDVYPESLLSQQRMGASGLLAHAIRRVDRWIAHQCRAVLVISRKFETLYRDDRGVPPERLHYIPNWIEGETARPHPEEVAAFRAAKGIPPAAVLLVFGGNIGAAAGVEALIGVFSRLRHRQCYLLIAGDGSRLDECRRLAAAGGNPRVLFHSPWPEKETALVLAAADGLILPTRGQQSQASVPSKLLAARSKSCAPCAG